MLDETIELFTERMKEIVLKDQRMETIPLAYLKTLEIPESVMHFFSQEVEIWLREEEEKFESDRFDYDQPEVRMLIDQIFDKLQQNSFFELTKFNHLLERAIKLELNYIVKPHRTLSQFIFKNSDTVSTMEVYDTLKYFFKFEYYKNAISDYFNTKYLRSISHDQFIDLINQIDQKAFEEDRLSTTLKTIKSIMAAISEARQTEITKLSIDILYDALSDRKLDDYSALVQKTKYETELSELTFDEIEALLKDSKLPGEKHVEAEPEESAFSSYDDIEESAPEVDVESIEVKESEVDLSLKEDEVEEEIDDLEEDEIEEEVAAPTPAPAPVADGNVASDLADHVAQQISSDTPLEDLNPMIVGRLRRKVVKKLFRKNEQDFVEFLSLLNKESSWKIASKIIDDEFYEREINPYSKEAISLSDIIYLRFFPKDKYVGDSGESKWD
ncbi:MAG: hypothetical protein D8M58_10745 [Calditrichaeota bacterium]|nr:MAG: hypothetical protein DWQ03_10120 [Calditrichota bacterium]MBL1205869.1 hypothetical protein [Calditrichota bacterium]NOG45697.1 hypothetical protein [Calditrichota bacterium]